MQEVREWSGLVLSGKDGSGGGSECHVTPSIITRGCSCYLRQEFHEHEILDDITRLRYEGNLPDDINGSLRNSLIRHYQEWKGTDYVPNNVDEALKWSKNDPMNLLPIVTDSAWEIIDKYKPSIFSKPVTNYVSAKGSIPVIKPQNESEHVNKKIKLDNEYTSSKIKLDLNGMAIIIVVHMIVYFRFCTIIS